MRPVVLLFVSLLLISCVHAKDAIAPAGQPQKTVSQQNDNQDKAEVTKHEEGLIIRGDVDVYLYFYKEQGASFMTLALFNGKKAVAYAVLDNENKPLIIVFMVLSEDGKKITERVTVPKTEKTAQLYEKMEQHVAKFVAKYEVKKILQENGINR